MHIGRNEPCPCGSGRKFKKCHGAMAVTPVASLPHADVARAEELKRADHVLTGKVLDFVERTKGPDWLARSIAEAAEAGGPPARDELQLLVPWVLFAYRGEDGGRPVAQQFMAKEAGRLSATELRLLAAHEDAWVSPCVVESVERGMGIVVHDRFADLHTFLHERSGSATAEPGMTFLLRAVRVDDIAFVAGMHPQPLWSTDVAPIVNAARKFARVRTRPIAHEMLVGEEFQQWVIDEWRAFAEARARPPELQNTDGDPLEFTVDRFEFEARDRDAMLARLAGIPGTEPPEPLDDGRLAIVVLAGGRTDRGRRSRQGASADTIIGTIRLGTAQLEIETNSARRADHLAEEVTRLCGALVRRRLRATTDTPAMLAEAQGRAGRGAPRALPAMSEEEMAVARAYKQRHYTAWLDDPIPMLGGRTPRAAARGGTRLREQLEDLLQLIERGEASVPEAERFDVAWLRAQLRI